MGGRLQLTSSQPVIWFDPSNPGAVVTSGGSVAQLTNLGTLGPTANATARRPGAVASHLLPTLNAANTAFNSMPTVSFGFVGGDTPEGHSTNNGQGNGTEMQFNNDGAAQ